MSSPLNAARAAIEALIRDGWIAAGYDAAAVSWPNTEFTPPATRDALWLQPRGLWGDAFEQTMGARGSGLGKNAVVGVLNLNLFARAGVGGGSLAVAADAMRDVVNRLEVSGVRFGAPSGPVPVESQDTAWAQVNVSVSFSVEEVV